MVKSERPLDFVTITIYVFINLSVKGWLHLQKLFPIHHCLFPLHHSLPSLLHLPQHDFRIRLQAHQTCCYNGIAYFKAIGDLYHGRITLTRCYIIK